MSRGVVGWALRVGVAAAIVVLLATGGRLSLGPAATVLGRPGVLLALLAIQLLHVFAGALRWWLLLRALQGARHSFARVLVFTWMGQFFGCVAPSSIAMDVTRFGYLRASGGTTRATALLSLLVDRACGAVGSCLVAVVLAHGLLSRLAIAPRPGWAIAAMVWSSMLAMIAVAWALARRDSWLPRFQAAARVALEARGALLVALLIAMAAHGLKVLSLWVVVRAVVGVVPPGAVIEPAAVGFLAEAIPLTPAGTGTSHLAFEWLLARSGVLGGAALFNAVFLARLLVSLGGGVVWIGWGGRRRTTPPSAVMRVVAGPLRLGID